MSQLIGAKSCRSCEHRVKLKEIPGKMFCRRFPPQVYGGVVPDATGRPALLWGATYPEINPDLPCGEYHRNDAHAGEEMAEAAKAAVRM
jgi:hypothetical protein